MITELRVMDKEKAIVPWWKTVERLKRRKGIKFKPGLNLVWGPNGCGKTTIIRAIAMMVHAEQGGQTTVTQHSLSDLFPGFSHGESEAERYRNGIVPVHDGQAVMHFDPATVVGMAYGGSGFDEDFGLQGMHNLMRRGSAGQDVLSRMEHVFAVLLGENEWPEIQWRVYRDRVNPLWQERIDLVEETLRGTIDKGQPTILLDEPDRSFDLVHQYGLWQRLRETADTGNYQLIVATHSLFAADIPGAHYIDVEKGYLRKCRRVIEWYFKEGAPDGRTDTSSG
jgi:predicted ATPase